VALGDLDGVKTDIATVNQDGTLLMIKGLSTLQGLKLNC
jgi:hypothetical protein